MKQITDTFLLIRPTISEESKEIIREFDSLVEVLKDLKLNCIVVNVDASKNLPKALFSCHWISFHKNGIVAVYPLKSKERQKERNESVLEAIEDVGFQINDVVDYSDAELEGCFLEGTASIVLDRENKIAYAGISEYTDEDLFIEFCEDFEYTPIVFSTQNKVGNPVSYSNTILSIGKSFAIIASSLIKDKKERKLVTIKLKESGKELLYISEEQMEKFAGNIVQAINSDGVSYILMSDTSFNTFTDTQKKILEKYGKIISLDIEMIEKLEKTSIQSILNPIKGLAKT